jgi:YgiT-type zinc finger domain-containing protein
MICRICGGTLDNLTTDMPFKLDRERIVIIKSLPVLQCRNCSEYLIEDAVMEKLDDILSNIDKTAELEVLSYAV